MARGVGVSRSAEASVVPAGPFPTFPRARRLAFGCRDNRAVDQTRSFHVRVGWRRRVATPLAFGSLRSLYRSEPLYRAFVWKRGLRPDPLRELAGGGGKVEAPRLSRGASL